MVENNRPIRLNKNQRLDILLFENFLEIIIALYGGLRAFVGLIYDGLERLFS